LSGKELDSVRSSELRMRGKECGRKPNSELGRASGIERGIEHGRELDSNSVGKSTGCTAAKSTEHASGFASASWKSLIKICAIFDCRLKYSLKRKQ
jgi:hypothetical protein